MRKLLVKQYKLGRIFIIIISQEGINESYTKKGKAIRGSKSYKAHPFKINGIEELTAYMISLIWTVDVLEGHLSTMANEIAAVKVKMNKAVSIANVVRKGPYSYSDYTPGNEINLRRRGR